MAHEGGIAGIFLDWNFHKLVWYEYVVYTLAAVFCCCFAGLMSGLNLAMMSFDDLTLEVIESTGKDSERRRATTVRRITHHRHWLLVTLLLMNALAMEALPIFLDQLVPSPLAIIVSVTGILVFGEVIPQAVCARFPLFFGWLFACPVFSLMILTFPVTFPLGKLLDCLLGGDSRRFFERKELEKLVALHQSPSTESFETAIELGGATSPSGHHHHHRHSVGHLADCEVAVITRTLELGDTCVRHVMTPLKDVFALSADLPLTRANLKLIVSKPFSRIPIHRRDELENLCGVLSVRSLVAMPKSAKMIRELKLGHLPAVHADSSIWKLLHSFQRCSCHMAAVVCTAVHTLQIESMNEQEPDPLDGVAKDVWDAPHGSVIGIVTLNDVIQELKIIDHFIRDRIDVSVDFPRKSRLAIEVEDSDSRLMSVADEIDEPM